MLIVITLLPSRPCICYWLAGGKRGCRTSGQERGLDICGRSTMLVRSLVDAQAEIALNDSEEGRRIFAEKRSSLQDAYKRWQVDVLVAWCVIMLDKSTCKDHASVICNFPSTSKKQVALISPEKLQRIA